MVIAIGAGVSRLTMRPGAGRIAAVLAAPLLVVGIVRSSTRTRDWKNNDVLFSRAVTDAPLVYRTHYMLGAWDIQQNRAAEGEREYRTAIALFDRDPGVFFTLGEQYMRAGMYKPAIDMFRRALAVDSAKVEARVRLALALAELGHWQEANAEALIALKQNTHAAPAMLSIMRWASAASKHPGAFDAGLAGVAFDSSGHAARPPVTRSSAPTHPPS
jgi:tetratricopeptide (TPR) repeat protein